MESMPFTIIMEKIFPFLAPFSSDGTGGEHTYWNFLLRNYLKETLYL